MDLLQNDREVVIAVKQSRSALPFASREQRQAIRSMMHLTATNKHMRRQAKGSDELTTEGFRRIVIELAKPAKAF